MNVEVGAGGTPWVKFLHESFTNNASNVVFLDHGETISDISPKQGKRIQGDTSAIPLKAESTDLIFGKDVFGSERESKGLYVGPVGDLNEIASEWFRVCKPGAHALILEVNTPQDAPIEKLRNAFEKAGFKLEKEYKGVDEISGLFKENASESVKRTFSTGIDYPNTEYDKSYALSFVKP